MILFLISIILFLNINNIYSQDLYKKYISKEKEYQDLLNNKDFWINSPIILEDYIIFFYKGKAKNVVLSGDFNNWEKNLIFSKTNDNFFIFYWNKKLKKGIYKYKLIVDNIWINDPFNTNYIQINQNEKVSYFELINDFIPNPKYPLKIDKNIYLFKYEDTKAKNVSIVGSFNNWNPNRHIMEYIGGGEFILKIELKPGLHSYCFVVDGEWVSDPLNFNQYRDATGITINIIVVK